MPLTIQQISAKNKSTTQFDLTKLSTAAQEVRLALSAVTLRLPEGNEDRTVADNAFFAALNINKDPDDAANEKDILDSIEGVKQFNKALADNRFRTLLEDNLRLAARDLGEDPNEYIQNFYTNYKTFTDYYELTDALPEVQAEAGQPQVPGVNEQNVQPVVNINEINDNAGEVQAPEEEIEIPGDLEASDFSSRIMQHFPDLRFGDDEIPQEDDVTYFRFAIQAYHNDYTYNEGTRHNGQVYNRTMDGQEEAKKWLAENYDRVIDSQYKGKTLRQHILDEAEKDGGEKGLLEAKQSLAYIKKQVDIFKGPQQNVEQPAAQEEEIEIPNNLKPNDFSTRLIYNLPYLDFEDNEIQQEDDYEYLRLALQSYYNEKQQLSSVIKHGGKEYKRELGGQASQKWLAENYDRVLDTEYKGKTLRQHILDKAKVRGEELEVKQALAFTKKKVDIFKAELQNAGPEQAQAEQAPAQPEVVHKAESWLNTIKNSAVKGDLVADDKKTFALVLAIRALSNSKVGHASSLQARLSSDQIKKQASAILKDPNFSSFMGKLNNDHVKMQKALETLKHGHCGGLETMFRDHVKNLAAGELYPTDAVKHYMPTVKERIDVLKAAAKVKVPRLRAVYKEAAEIVALRNACHAERNSPSSLDVKIPTTKNGELQEKITDIADDQTFKVIVRKDAVKTALTEGHGGDMVDKMREQLIGNNEDDDSVVEFINTNTMGGRIKEIRNKASELKNKLDGLDNPNHDDPEMQALASEVKALTAEYLVLTKKAFGEEPDPNTFAENSGKNVKWGSLKKDTQKLLTNNKYQDEFGIGYDRVKQELDRMIDKEPGEYIQDPQNVTNRIQSKREAEKMGINVINQQIVKQEAGKEVQQNIGMIES